MRWACHLLLVMLGSGCVRVLELDVPDSATEACVPGETQGFVMPDARWALASLHAERILGGLEDSQLASIDADFVLAVGFMCHPLIIKPAPPSFRAVELPARSAAQRRIF